MSRAFPSLVLALASLLAATPVAAAEPASCKAVRFADVGWSDIAAANGLASVVLEALGYQPSATLAALPVAMTGMKNRQIDAFLGYWKPSMVPVVEPFVRDAQVEVLEAPNLSGARYTLAVPRHLHDKGLRSFADIARFEKALEGRIHGIEAGSEANAPIRRMIRDNRFGLGGFTLVESSEAAMLAQVQAASRSRKAIVFLAWEPHPMNVQLKMHYLSGGDEVFGPGVAAHPLGAAWSGPVSEAIGRAEVGSEIWDLRPEGVTVLGAATGPDPGWASLADAALGVLEGGP